MESCANAPIQVLPREVAAKIAAGEVVERPVSVAKELIENSLDAGASRIDVEVRGGGVNLLRVVDNGSGILSQDTEKAFCRYATSKITSADDLERIGTLGFRGEALASIAAVSEMTVITRTKDEVGASYLRLMDGQLLERQSRAAAPGTSVTVRRLFRNVPARLKFLRSDAAETNRITTLVGHYGLSHPEVALSLRVEGRLNFSSDGSGDLRSVLASLYGVDVASGMLEVSREARIGDLSILVSGLVSGLSTSRANRNQIAFFVNRRPVKNRSLAFAVVDAYRGLMQGGRYPISALHLVLDPSETDVNVHPAKSEIKFRDEGMVFSAVHRAVGSALDQGPIARSVSLDVDSPIESSGAEVPLLEVAEREIAPSARPTESSAQAKFSLPALRVIGQIQSTYIVSEGPDGMYLIDQHTAHERVLFDQLRREKGKGEIKAQGILDPVTVELTPRQENILQDQLETLQSHGFTIEPFGQRTIILRSVPAALASRPPARSLLDILDRLESEDLTGYDWEDRILATVACHSAVRAGHDLEALEMQEMIRLLESAENPKACPHGRPIMLHMSTSQLEHEFGRR